MRRLKERRTLLWYLCLLAFPGPVARWIDTGECKWDWGYPGKLGR